jgi:hypothetical protein
VIASAAETIKLVTTNIAGVSANAEANRGVVDGLKSVRADIVAIEDAVNGMDTSKTCADLDHTFEGGTVKGVPFPGSTLTFTCNTGKYLEGANKLTCDGETGEYDKDAPTCTQCDENCLACDGANACTLCDTSKVRCSFLARKVVQQIELYLGPIQGNTS